MTPQQIDHLTQLLLHPNANNIELAKTLLEPCYPTVLPQMREASFVYLCFEHQDKVFIQWANEVGILPSEEWQPLSILAQAQRVLNPGRHAMALEALPVWKRYSACLEQNRTWTKQYRVAYQQLSRYSGHSTWIHYAPLYLFLLRKIVRFRLANTPDELYDAQRKLVGLLHQHTAPAEATPALIQEIRALYQAVHRYKPNDHTLLKDCGEFYETVAGDTVEAQRYYQRYIRVQPNDPNGYSNLARIARQQQQPALAQDWLQKGIAQADQVYQQAYGSLFCELAAVQWEAFGNAIAAEQTYRAALDLGSVVVLEALKGYAFFLLKKEGVAAVNSIFEEMLLRHFPNSLSERIRLEWGAFWVTHGAFEEALNVYESGLLECKAVLLITGYVQALSGLLLKLQQKSDMAALQQWLMYSLKYTNDQPLIRVELLSALAHPSFVALQTLPALNAAYCTLLQKNEWLNQWINATVLMDKRWLLTQQLFDYLTTLQPQQPETYRVCGRIYEKHHEFAHAQSLYEHALEQVTIEQDWFQDRLMALEQKLASS